MLNTRIALIATMLLSLSGPTLWANPNHKDPEAFFAAHGTDEVQAMHKNLTAMADQAYATMQQEIAAAQKGRLKSLNGRKLAQTRTKHIQMLRLAEQIQMYGEPSGAEIMQRSAVIGPVHYSGVTRAWAGLPTSERFLTQLRTKLRKEEKDRVKVAAKLKELVAQEKWDTAEEALHQVLDRIEADGLSFLGDKEITAIMVPFVQVGPMIKIAAARRRAARAEKLLAESRAQQLPDFKTVLSEIQQAVNNIGTAGQTAWATETVDGPKLVEKIGDQWKEVHVASLRCRALDWANLARTNRAMSGPPQANKTDTLGSEYVAFSDGVVKALSELMALEAKRTGGKAPPELYLRYLSSLAPLMRQVSNPSAVDIVDQAVKDFAKATTAFGPEVEAYDAGTTELLRWRARAATSLSKSREPDFQALHARVLEATRSQQEYIGLFSARGEEAGRPHLLACAPRVLAPALQKLVGARAHTSDVMRVSPTSRASIARYEARTFATLSSASDIAAEMDLLKYDLLVNDQAPPLTLTSAISVDSAERGAFAASGGTIAGVHLEALITRFASIKPVTSILVPLGELPVDTGSNLLSQTVMRFELEPSWVQHEHFFVELTPSGAE